MAKLLILVTLSSIFTLCQSGYLPQLQMCASTPFINKQITKFGPIIEKKLDQTKLPDQSFDDKVDGVHVQFNLTNIKQKIGINWNANVINIKDEQTFVLNSKNINLTLNGHIEFKVGLALKQKGELVVNIEKMEADTTLAFTQPHCNSADIKGLGFDVQIESLFVNTDKITIQIQHKGIDNAVIKALMSVLKSRLPAIIEKQAKQIGNPLISKMTCTPIQQLFSAGSQNYMAIINTTNIPHFIGKQLYAALDVTFVNAVTNATNNQVQNDNLPEQNLFVNMTQLSLLASSNMMNTIMWLVQDSKILQINVTNARLGPNPPIELNTLNLSILIPGLIKYGRKQVILLISSSSKFSQLYIRNGKIVAAASLSIKFVVNNTGHDGGTVQECLKVGECIVACDLNATIPLSAAVNMVQQGNMLFGLLHTLEIAQLQVISSQVPIKIEQLKKILNTMIGSARPQINQQLQGGMPLNITMASKYQVENVLLDVRKNFAAVGIMFKK